MLIVKGVEDVHALHVLQFAALILCIMCMMTKGFEVKCALEITQDVLPCSLCPKHCCWLNVCVAIASQAVASLKHLLHLFISVNLRSTIGNVAFLLRLIFQTLYFVVVK